MLTDQALHDRKWKEFPSVGRIIGHHSLHHPHLSGPLSVPDNTLSRLGRLAEVAALVQKHLPAIQDANGQDVAEQLPEDLWKLAEALDWAAAYYAKHADVVRSLAAEVLEQRRRRVVRRAAPKEGRQR